MRAHFLLPLLEELFFLDVDLFLSLLDLVLDELFELFEEDFVDFEGSLLVLQLAAKDASPVSLLSLSFDEEC